MTELKPSDFMQEPMMKFMEQALIESLHKYLRERIMTLLEADIKAAIDKACEEMRVHITTHLDPTRFSSELIMHVAFNKEKIK